MFASYMGIEITREQPSQELVGMYLSSGASSMRVVSGKRTPTLLSVSWKPKPYLTE